MKVILLATLLVASVSASATTKITTESVSKHFNKHETHVDALRGLGAELAIGVDDCIRDESFSNTSCDSFIAKNVERTSSIAATELLVLKSDVCSDHNTCSVLANRHMSDGAKAYKASVITQVEIDKYEALYNERALKSIERLMKIRKF